MKKVLLLFFLSIFLLSGCGKYGEEDVVKDFGDKVKDAKAYYVEGRTAEEIGNKLYFQLFNQTRSDRHIQRIIEKATNKMLEL